MSKIAYYPGCSGLGTSIEYDKTTRSICHALGVELVEFDDWNCCGSTPAHTVDHVLSAALSARNLALVEKQGYDLVTTPCPSCLANLRTAEEKMKNADFREKVNALLDTPYQGNVETQSVLQVLVERVDMKTLAEKVVKPLSGLKIACYYGCIMNRPPELMRFDNHEYPMTMDNIMTALGAEVVPYPLKVECCGASFGIPRPDIVARLSGNLLDAGQRLEADAFVTACPLCQMNLDMRQGQVNRAMQENFSIPIFYYTQLMGYALGIEEKELGFEKLCVNPRLALEKIKQPALAE